MSGMTSKILQKWEEARKAEGEPVIIAAFGVSIPSTEKKQRDLEQFYKKHDDDTYCGAIGGRFSLRITATSLGYIYTIEDGVSKEFINLTDFSNF